MVQRAEERISFLFFRFGSSRGFLFPEIAFLPSPLVFFPNACIKLGAGPPGTYGRARLQTLQAIRAVHCRRRRQGTSCTCSRGGSSFTVQSSRRDAHHLCLVVPVFARVRAASEFLLLHKSTTRCVHTLPMNLTAYLRGHFHALYRPSLSTTLPGGACL